MKIILLTSITCFVLTLAVSGQCKVAAGLPDRACSPGVSRTTDVQVICKTPASQFRPTKYQEAKFKKQVMAEYRIPYTEVHKYVLDHVIPIEAGGDGFALANMFPQTLLMGHKKDLVENFIKRQICTGKMTAAGAQAAIAKNWKAIKIK